MNIKTSNVYNFINKPIEILYYHYDWDKPYNNKSQVKCILIYIIFH